MVPGYQPIEVIPNCVNLADYRNVCEAPQPETLIFTGSFRYSANHDAMVWFLSEVYPRIRAQIPSVRLSITGDHADLPLPPAGNVVLTGFVDDVRPLIASSWVGLAPIRIGGGTRLKILEAMALRTPVVATSKGAEGLELEDEEHLLIADTPEGFAEAVVRLLRKPRLRKRLVDHGYQAIQEKYDWPAVMPRFLELVEQVAHD
jgi:glycosyltransferase involved in cell wall biosynthesis